MNLLILLLPIAAIFLMFRSQKKRQQQAQTMQSALEPGAAVRTIGGMYAQVIAINESSVELEIAPGVVTHFSKSAIAAVIEPQEYDEIINGRPEGDESVELTDEHVEDELLADEHVEDEAVREDVSLEKADSDTPAAK
ncbi:preprotein translocase subunit YajC [Kitasatospora sp. GAS204A]|uniref:preprotein translocase subunit YajC n=1 Tax=unclassified Kitasatospora TaxID=2633591 RepID=UPI00247375DC|nr:preprotein translocase subunit YajC [Kitasatospora sp. GAS204B]MDH6122783.1 preprotein translocase subunit YajC [Kitasatospora sp. GAS204B]